MFLIFINNVRIYSQSSDIPTIKKKKIARSLHILYFLSLSNILLIISFSPDKIINKWRDSYSITQYLITQL